MTTKSQLHNNEDEIYALIDQLREQPGDEAIQEKSS